MKKLLFLLLLCLASWPALAGDLENATLEMRYRLGENLRQEMEISRHLNHLNNWLEEARQEETKLKSNLEQLARMQQEISRQLPDIVAREKQIQNEMAALKDDYQAQLRTIYLYAPVVDEWLFASEEQFALALESQHNLDILLKARLERLRQLRVEAAELELDLSTLQARQRQMFELAGQMQITKNELAELGMRRARALSDINRQGEDLKQNQARLLDAQARLERASSLNLPSIAASQAPSTGALQGKGSFFAPVQGRILSPGKERFSLLEAPPGSQVRAPWAGVVAFADYVPGYRRLLLIDHGDRLYSVLAHLESIQVEPGQMVGAGQVVGVMDSSGLLYMEIRHGVKLEPVEEWLFTGEQ